jgi:hypothetical protein
MLGAAAASFTRPSKGLWDKVTKRLTRPDPGVVSFFSGSQKTYYSWPDHKLRALLHHTAWPVEDLCW